MIVRQLLLIMFALLCFTEASAHDSRPVFIRVEVDPMGGVLLAWKVPDTVAALDAPVIRLGPPCLPASTDDGVANAARSLQGLLWFQCAKSSEPPQVEIEWLRAAPSLSTLVRYQSATGISRTLHASPGTVTIELPMTPSTGAVFRQYLTLGIEHILAGFDHLLFVGCLVLLASSFRRIALAITGFTIAHSVTLIGAALEVVRLPIPPVEAVIALSIVFLAAELARERRDTLTWRYPMVVAAAFGLLHGFGFAAVLGDIGLPDGEALAALLSFNLGVEVGQLVFVVALLVIRALVRYAMPAVVASPSFTRYAAYPMGVLAMFWTMDRLSGFA